MMKTRYVFPILYFSLVLLALLLKLEGVLMLMIAPQALLTLAVETALGVRFGDVLIYQVGIGVVASFVLGLLVDAFLGKLSSKSP